MKELAILTALIQCRDAFETIAKYHEPNDLSDIGEIIYSQVSEYYSTDTDANRVSIDSLLLRIQRKYPKQYDKFEQVLTKLPEVSLNNTVQDYCAVKMDSIGKLVGGYLLAGEHNKADEMLTKYRMLYEEGLTEDVQESAVVCIGLDVAEFSETFDKSNRIPIAPAVLNNMLGGGLIAGSHTLVYAPPECGKTATAITMAFAACYKGKRTLYVGNEEARDLYLMRILSRFSGMAEGEIRKSPDKAMVVARSNGYDNLIFAHCSPGNTDEVKALALEHEAQVVIIDQLHNLGLKDSKGKQPEKTIMLEKLAYEMRMFFSKYKIAGISFTQADEKAIGKLFLEIKNVYYSNIGVQGQVDVMIGIGMDDAHKSMGRRVMNIVKNKLSGVHSHAVVQIVNDISSVRGLEV